MGINPPFQHEGATKPDSLAVDSYEHSISASRVMELPSNQQVFLDFDGDNPIYVGVACSGFATTDGTDDDINSPNWMIRKISWSGNTPTMFQTGWGRWSNRTNLTYS